VNENKTSIVTIDGEILQINLIDAIDVLDEPLVLNGKSILNLRAIGEFDDLKEINLISDKGDYISLRMKYSNDNFEPYFFLNKNSGKSKLITKSNEDLSYKIEAKRINSMLKRMFTKTKYAINGFKIELVSAYAKDDKLYLRFEFENNTPYPFKSDLVLFKIIQNNSFNKRSSPEEIITPIYEYSEDEINIKPGSNLFKTYVFNAFKIIDERIFKISVLEKNSSLEYYLPIMSKLINEPNSLFYNENNVKNDNVF